MTENQSDFDDLTIIVVSYNTHDLLHRCLGCLKTLQAPFKIQVIVVDNASSDGSAQSVQNHYPEVHLVRNRRNLGFAQAINQGITISQTEYLLLLNSDAFLYGQAMVSLAEFMSVRPDVGICGPQLLHSNGMWQRSYGRIPSPGSALLAATGITSLADVWRRIAWRHAKTLFRPRQVEYVDGACMLVRREVIEQVGSFDEQFFMYVEDAEFCLRAHHHGWKVFYVPYSQVVHLRGESLMKRNNRQAEGLKMESLKRFILDRYGYGGWDSYVRWMRWEFRIRYSICRVLSLFGLVSSSRCLSYADAAGVYSSERQLLSEP